MDAVMNKVRLGFLILGLEAFIFFILGMLPSSTETQSEEAFGDHPF